MSTRDRMKGLTARIHLSRRAALGLTLGSMSLLAVAGPRTAFSLATHTPADTENNDNKETTMAQAPDPTFYDRMAIRELIETYADRLNHADWEGYANTLAEDIVFRVSEPDTFLINGRDNLVKLVSEGYKGGFVHQMAHNIVVDRVNGDHARARHTLHVVSTRFRLIALYYDGLVRTPTGWKFAERDVQITYKEEGPLPGKQYRELPGPNPQWYDSFAQG